MKNHIILQTNQGWHLQRMYIDKFHNRMLVKSIHQNSAEYRARLNYEFSLFSNNITPWLLKPIAVDYIDQRYGLIYEDFDGIALINFKNMTISQFLQVAIELSNICISLHQNQILFLAFNPYHILIHPDSLKLKLLSSDTSMKYAIGASIVPDSIQLHLQQLPYYAPEQTGRLNMAIDYRADLYALGAIFYQLLSGAPPFTGQNTIDIIYNILSKKPAPLLTTQHKNLFAISRIIEKLLEKHPSARYQSAVGLREDLLIIQKALLADEKLEDFDLGTEDITLFPTLTSKLYGREQQTATLIHLFEQVTKGDKKVALISGEAGVGKSQLVYGLKGEVAKAKGYFIETKYNQLQLDNDFTSVIYPLRDLLKQLYMEGERSVRNWRSHFEKVQLHVTADLTILLPELRWFYDNNSIQDISYEDSKQLQAYLFSSIKKILQSFAHQKKPIVLLIDDLHWADKNTLQALFDIYEQHREGFLMVISTLRLAEKSAEEEKLLKDMLPSYKHMELKALKEADITLWLQESLHMHAETTDEIVKHLTNLTNGNPLFIRAVFSSLQQDDTIYLDFESKQWRFNIQKFNQAALNSELLLFLENKLANLQADTLHVLQIAACLGTKFDFHLLRQLVNFTGQELLKQLDLLITNGFIIPLNTDFKWASQLDLEEVLLTHTLTFQFVHNRFHQAAYKKLSEQQKLELHYQIGQLFTTLLTHSQDSYELHEVVKHFNYCRSLLSDQERYQLAIWNYQLGVNTKKVGLLENALSFLTISQDLLPSNCWQVMRKEAMDIYIHLGECECLLGHFESSDKHLSEALLHSETLLEKLSIYNLKTLLYIEEEDPHTSIEAGLTGLAEAKMPIPAHPNKLQVLNELIKLQIALHNKSDKDLLNTPNFDNKEMEIAVQLLINMAASTVRIDSNLTGISLMRAFRLQLKYGLGAKGAIIFVNYAMLLNSGFGNIKEAIRFSQLAIEVADKQDSIYIKGHVYYVYGLFISHWTDSYETSIYYMRKAQQYCREIGLYLIVTTASCFIIVAQLIRGTTISELQREIKQQQDEVSLNATSLTIDFLAEMALWMNILRDPYHPIEWSYPFQIQDQPIIKMMHYSVRLQMSFLLNNEQQALAVLALLNPIYKEVFDLPITTRYYFYRALWQFNWLAQHKGSQREQKRYRTEIKESIEKFKKWMKFAPQHYEHLYLLLLAENCRLNNKDEKAKLYYDRAIQLAKMRHFIQDCAIAYERAANYYKIKGNDVTAHYYSAQAIHAARQWEAETVARQWEMLYDVHSMPLIEQHSNLNSSLEMLTVLETTQSFAKDIQMEGLLQNILFSLLKHASATVGYFIHKRADELIVLAKAEADNTIFATYEQQHLEQFHENMQSIVRYVIQSEEPCIIQNTKVANALLRTPSTAKSILCLPIHHKSEIIAVLYLENILTVNAFHATHIDLLKMLSTQIAISIENAQIYEELEQRVQARTRQVDETNQHLKKVNEQLAKNELERKKLLHSISHELRSPITSSLGYIELILDGVITEEEEKVKYLTRGKERLLSLNMLIQDLFDLANLESGRAEYRFNKISAKELFQQFELRYEHEVGQLGLQYSANFYGSPYAQLLVDPARIQQVFENIMSNAMKYTKSGSIELAIYTNDEQFICSIKDSGIGIPTSDIPFVFDSYYRASNSTIKNSHGIGLAICQQIITQHQGEISVTSSEYNGSTFTFTLPLLKD
ncbi:ATP-binding protein [Metasolibacillus meyeri]|uniref:histidine kinase n=1 Tax=Metasolibacillus meyeri TaxID=1071052 RepID=A0AAW9NMX7_9BACL|nr:ATP-binding protein [Metasolibacillus meyeri]MEC1178770.1 ATP-binding protein [Metasolibacillus meyeri]